MEQEKKLKGTLFCHCLASSVSDPHGIILYPRKTVVFTLSIFQYSHTSDILFPLMQEKKKIKDGEKNNYSHLKLYQQGTNN